MKNIKKLLSISSLLIVFTNSQALAATGNATVKVVKALTITEDSGQTLNFGSVITRATAGTVVIDSDAVGAKNASSTADTINNSGFSSGKFDLDGEANLGYSVSLGNGGVATLTKDGDPSKTMNTSLTLSSTSGSLNGSGIGEVYVGGTLSVGANQDVGTYNGTYTITANY